MAIVSNQFTVAETPNVTQLVELDELVALHVTGDVPEMYWEDSHGHFQFDNEEEARLALADPYYQKFLPFVDWSQTVIRQVHVYRPYCSDPAVNWRLVEKATALLGALNIWRESGRWFAAFGSHANACARTPGIAICLAALGAKGITVEVHHDRLDSQISQIGVAGAEKEAPSADIAY